MTPTEWKQWDPSHRSSKKHQPLTDEETMATVHAFHPDTVTKVNQTRAEIDAAWKQMQHYW